MIGFLTLKDLLGPEDLEAGMLWDVKGKGPYDCLNG